MAQPVADERRANLRKRVLSAVVLAPIVVAAVLLGRPWFHLLVLTAGGVLAWEWARLVDGGRFGPAGWLLLAAVIAAIATAFTAPPATALAIAAGIVLSVLVGARVLGSRRPGWIAGGLVYIALPCAAILWLRDRPAGLDLVLWLMLVTWAADTGAFTVGRSLGGPRLAPRISPGKTWSGLVGGLLAAAVMAGAYGALRGAADPVAVALAGLLLGLVAAGGDLLESAVKRRFAVKDASAVIPGHGGLLDRVDSLLLVALAAGILVLSGWELFA